MSNAIKTLNQTEQKTYFFCGIGGSGMSALARIFACKGNRIIGSDRAYDRGQSPEKFKAFEQDGIQMVPQDGSSLSGEVDALIVSSAIEDSVPDIKAARDIGIPIIKRAELLAKIFNSSETGIAVAGTSGKSTVTGMIATVLKHVKLDPTVMNGGGIRNFGSNMHVGEGQVFVAETDESDGSIALFNPAIAVLNNIALDHKSLDELERLFDDFIGKATQAVVLNFDDDVVKALAVNASTKVIGYGLKNEADIFATEIKAAPDGISFKVGDDEVCLKMPGRHNVLNALACLAVCQALGIERKEAIQGLEKFEGIARRFEMVGTKNNITVIDDFAHNPDKIAATLQTLKEFDGRLIVTFQPHGFGPLKLMGREIAAVFSEYLDETDILLMPEPYYAGGTADRSVTSKDIVTQVGGNAHWFEERKEILSFVSAQVQPGDRVIVMGARDDTLSDFAQEILAGL